MRAPLQNTLIIALSAAAAGLDAWSYFGLGHVFVANMTGNTVLLGFSIFGGVAKRAILSAIPLCFYTGGAFAGSLLARPIRAQLADRDPSSPEYPEWPARATLILSLECVVVVAVAIAQTVLVPVEASVTAASLIAILAFAIGLQSATINALKLPGVVTTYMTGTWTMLSSGVAQLTDGEKKGRERQPWIARLRLEAVVLVAYLGSALACGLIYRYLGRAQLGCYPAALLIFVVAAASLGRTRR